MKKVLKLMGLLGLMMAMPSLVNAQQQNVITISVKGVSFKMVRVQGGTFNNVALSDYYIGETEVTQELWEAVMGKNPSHFKGANRPVESVSWNDCQKFIKKLNKLTGTHFRLPTELEWEFAARGGNKSRGYMYAGGDNIDAVAWYWNNACDVKEPDYGTHPVAKKAPNELGIYDMSGNVEEWCNDCFRDYSLSEQKAMLSDEKAPKGFASYRMERGGCWMGSAGGCSVSDRDFESPKNRQDHLGLRLAQ